MDLSPGQRTRGPSIKITWSRGQRSAAVVEMRARRTTAEILQDTLTKMDTEAERLRPP